MNKPWRMKAYQEISLNGQNIKGGYLLGCLNPTRGHEQAGVRPVVIISHDVFNNKSGDRHCNGNHKSASKSWFSVNI